MQTYEIVVQNRSVRGNSSDMTLVRTSVGIDQMHVLFDSAEWLEFPVTVTFAQDEDIVTQSMVVTEVSGSESWVAQSTCLIPHEVIDTIGPIRVTFQGTDSEGRHIITAKGSPLSVEEAGDVDDGQVPAEVPTVDEWTQAYSNAMAAANAAQSAADRILGMIDTIVSDATGEVQDIVSSFMVPATTESLGIVQVGDGLSVTDDGVLSAIPRGSTGMTDEQLSVLANLQLLAGYCFDTEFDEDGMLKDTARIKPSAFPIATLDNAGIVCPDGATVKVDDDGMVHATYVSQSWEGTVLTMHTIEGSHSVDLMGPTGPQGPEGPQGPVGPQGPSGYVLTDEDIESVSEAIYERYLLGDETRY